MNPVIHLGIDPSTWPDGAVERVTELATGYEVLVTTDRDEIERNLDRIEIALARFPHDLIARAPALAWVQQQGAGADWLTRHPEARAHDFTLTSASGVHAVPISEHMLGFLLALGRGFLACIRGQRDRVWDANRDQELFELEGRRVLILGVGAIGERFAVLCRACGMETVGMRRDPSIPADGVDRMAATGALLAELPYADVVANTLPYTDETHHLLGADAFAAMKAGTIVVNIGRGGTIDEDALVAALRDGTVGAAGLDVFETEPLPEDSPLWDMENVLITPHYAGLTPRYNERLFDIFIDNLERYLRGGELRNVVDKRLGY
ncbi:MAG: D-2-hydroxyacid dehydrogenase [Spirochaetota bacterium]